MKILVGVYDDGELKKDLRKKSYAKVQKLIEATFKESKGERAALLSKWLSGFKRAWVAHGMNY
jgi:hypothetical protein